MKHLFSVLVIVLICSSCTKDGLPRLKLSKITGTYACEVHQVDYCRGSIDREIYYTDTIKVRRTSNFNEITL